MADQEDNYKVGYGKPPRERRFVKGVSGNPKGRPKGAQSVATIFTNISSELITVQENGQRRVMPKIEAVVRQSINKALSGYPRSIAVTANI